MSNSLNRLVGLGCAAALTAYVEAAPPRYRIVDVMEGTGAAVAEPRSINNSNAFAGNGFVFDEFTTTALRWDAQQQPAALPRLPGDNSSEAWRIRDDGVIVGASAHVRVERVGDLIRVFTDAKAAIWQDGVISDLNTRVAPVSPLKLRSATGINAAGAIVGNATPLTSSEPHGYLLAGSVLTNLGTIESGWRAAFPSAINDDGLAVGWTDFQARAFRWERGVARSLHNFPEIQGVASRAFDVNNAGIIVGEAQFRIFEAESPAVWRDGRVIKLVPAGFTRPQGAANAVNERGQIVGYYIDLDRFEMNLRGFIWEDGQFYELLDLIDDPQGFNHPMLPFDVNEAGWIVGRGYREGRGLDQAFVMIPISTLGDMNCDGAVNFDDISGFVVGLVSRSAYEKQFPACEWLNGDITGDGSVNFDDIDGFVRCIIAGRCEER